MIERFETGGVPAVDDPAAPEPPGARLVLVKIEGMIGGAPVGSEYVVKMRPDLIGSEKARALAFRMLQRSMPDENLMCWRVKADPGPTSTA